MQHENQRIESVSRFFCESAKLLGYLVDLIGIEPMTSSMPWKRAPSCATGPHWGCNSSIVSAWRGFVKRWHGLKMASPWRRFKLECKGSECSKVGASDQSSLQGRS